MADTAVVVTGPTTGNTSDPKPEQAPASLRKIEFHLARRPYNGFSNNRNTNGFKLVTLNPNSSGKVEPQKPTVSDMKGDGPEFMENVLDPELSFQITFRRIGAGLRNLGNTCFLNSVLQCLTYTEPLAAYLQSGKHQTSCRTAGFCALCAIQKHVSRALQATGRILEPKDLVSNLRCISRNFRNARQEDAHEYMVNLLESMHKCCLPSGVPSESPSAYERSLVHKIFGGSLRSQVKCMQCSYCSNKFDPFLDLSLEIIKADSLYKALAHFTAKEQLDGGAKQYQCQQCKQKVRALKQLSIDKAPHVLAVHLKRFGSHIQGQKIDKRIEFGPTLDLKPFVTGPYDGDLKYTLYGVLVHAGWSTHSGHYYCFVRTSSGMWYSLDDNQVVQVSEKKVLEQKAYMLFYFRDRRTFAPKKSVGVVQKENMVMNALGSAAFSKHNPGSKENIQNGSRENKLNGSSKVTIAHRDALSGSPTENQSKEGSSHEANATTAVDCSPLRSEPKLEPSQVLQQSNKSVMLPSMEMVVGNSVAKSVSRNNTSGHTSTSVQDERIAKSCMNNVLKDSRDSITNKAISISVGRPSSNSEGMGVEHHQRKAADTLLSGNVIFASSGTASNSKESEMSGTKAVSVEASPIAGHGESLEQINNEEIKEKESKCLLGGKENDRKALLKVKKKPLKCQAISMQLSRNIISGASFPLRKRHKRRKHPRNKYAQPDNSSNRNEISTDLGPSTSESAPISTGRSIDSKNKRAQGGSANKDSNLSVERSTDIARDNIDAFKDRTGENGTVLSSKELQHGGPVSGSKRKPSAVQEFNSSENGAILRQSGTTSMLARVLEETRVARWDGTDTSHLEMDESESADIVQIGYIGDEWDEEYDQGKRKKVRGPKIDFSGPNLFQQLATKGPKAKKAALRRSSHGNQPFRI